MEIKRIFVFIALFFISIPLIIFLVFVQSDYFLKHNTPVFKETEVFGYIGRVYQNHGVTSFTMVDGRHFRTKAIYKSSDKDDNYGEYLKIYDSIYKAANSDTIFIFRRNEKLIFTYKETPRLSPDELDLINRK